MELLILLFLLAVFVGWLIRMNHAPESETKRYMPPIESVRQEPPQPPVKKPKASISNDDWFVDDTVQPVEGNDYDRMHLPDEQHADVEYQGRHID